MPTLTQAQITELAALANKSLTQFTNADAIRYYEILHQAGFSYGTLALGVVIEGDTSHSQYSSYSSLSGKYANTYSSLVADDFNVDFSVGSTAWLEMQHRLMQNDWSDRVSTPNFELSYNDIDDNHADAFNVVGLPPKTFTAHVPVSQLMDINASTGESLWAALKTGGNGYAETAIDGLATVSSLIVTNPAQSAGNIVQDIVDKANWSAKSFKAFVALGTVYVQGELAPALYQEFWDQYDALDEFFGSLFPSGEIPELTAADVSVITPHAGDSEVLPTSSWYSSTLTFFGVTLTAFWDPLVIDIDGDGITADYEPPTFVGGQNIYQTYFDLDGDGFAQAVGWHGDGFLVRDLNSNGRIDNGLEMFGDATTDGFTALGQHDSNTDGVINASDAIWSDLQIWEDENLDGQTQSDELHSLSSLDITDINLASNVIQNGIGLTHTGTVTTSTGTREAGNYNFQMDVANTRYAQDYNFDVRAAF
ncbi:MAG: hypothetical protein AAFR98_12885 [Pseudomonadota bacterium]